ncbi:MAG: hypothetical protein KatS3mg008_1045 [Acidimicrobiales bacterium]|nr:MAG: hypothetical protein KatS3mg008_1045 [Acidimicrobiales bacterium]
MTGTVIEAHQRGTTPVPTNKAVGPVFRTKRKLPWPLEIYSSAVGKKWVMAVSGVVLLGFVLVHMIGNLHLYEGPEKVNAYAEALRELGGELAPRTFVLWVFRIGLAAAFVVHLHAAWSLTMINRKARAVPYQSKRDWIAANFASRTMRWSGLIVGAYVLFHLADLTWGTANPDFVRGDVYHNVVASFSRVPVAAFYVVANVLLSIHIYHGAWSIFQSLGASNPRFDHLRRWFAGVFAAVILVGNVSFPVAVQLGLIDEDGRQIPVAASASEEG